MGDDDMVERSFSEPVKVAELEPEPTLYRKPRWDRKDFWLVLTGAVLGGIVSIMFGFGLYLLLEMGM
jgi:hypothetical protein